MTTSTMTVTTIEFGSGTRRLRWLERVALMRSHPVAIVVDLAASIWCVYFLWTGAWLPALGTVVVGRGLATGLVWRLDQEAMASTSLGKMALLHLHPANLLIQSVGALLSLWGVWTHAPLTILAGITAIILGHAFGWSKVHPAFKL